MSAEREADVLRYAQQLATSLWEQHWKDRSPEWKPCTDIIGVLIQIDNMTAGMERSKEEKP